MSEIKDITLDTLHSYLNREIQNDIPHEMPLETYTSIAEFLDKFANEQYDDTRNSIRDAMINLIKTMASLLLRIRLEKAHRNNGMYTLNLLNLEKYILSMNEKMIGREKSVSEAILNGQTELLKSMSQEQNKEMVLTRFLKPADVMMGVDLKQYGPFESEDVATIPFENAHALVTQNIAVFIEQ